MSIVGDLKLLHLTDGNFSVSSSALIKQLMAIRVSQP